MIRSLPMDLSGGQQQRVAIFGIIAGGLLVLNEIDRIDGVHGAWTPDN
jgi:ABC-type polar amino acid transport system ATPase subunit